MKTVFITGASSGLGKLTAAYFAQQGWNVAATLRNPAAETELSKLKNVRLFKLDVTDVQQVQRAVGEAIDAFGAIDVVVNNAGAGSYGPLEFAAEETIDWQFQVNVRGPINVIRAFLPHFRARRGGMFINISSFMGVTTVVPTGSLYNMSKFALEGLTEGLYYELKPLGIELRLIEPGGSRGNNFKRNIVFNANDEIHDYDAVVDKVQALFDATPEELMDDPQTIADAIFASATGTSQQFRTLLSKQGQDLLALRNELPIDEYLERMAAMFR
jgi:NAD(P)-dependent dehydrogenase (short-subunit alcohol dehydrogenase family)